MLLDAALPFDFDLHSVPQVAHQAELLGFNTIWTAETKHDPFLPGPLIFEHTKSLNFGTAIAVGFARSPTTLAYTAWDLARSSKGRFILGLGTQIKPHIERRFGLPWPDSPAGKLREQVEAIRALWQAWQNGSRLNYRGDYYRLTLMSPFFDPGPIEHPNIPIYLAGVNTGLASLAGEIADGFHVHPLHSPKYLENVIRPAIQAGADKKGKQITDCAIAASVFVITNDEEREFVRQQIAFYASTPSYRAVMDLHGWTKAAEALSHYASRKQWDQLPGLIDDRMLDKFSVAAPADKLAVALKERYRNLVDRVTLYLPYQPGKNEEFWEKLTSSF